ncbi:MAG TPA: hypothetical protein VHA75_08090 [Rugosimonospora sp.]|nr:hypothetical protein [Rugosimonospora sp.]
MTVDVHRPRTAAATAARKRQHAEKLAGEIAHRVEDLDRPVLAALLVVLTEEVQRRRK